MTFVLIALGVAILMAVAKDKARRFPEPQSIGTKNGVIHPSPTPNIRTARQKSYTGLCRKLGCNATR